MILSLLWVLPAFIISMLGSFIAAIEAFMKGDFIAGAVCLFSTVFNAWFVFITLLGAVAIGPFWAIVFFVVVNYFVAGSWAFVGYQAANQAVVREAYEKTKIVASLAAVVVKTKAVSAFENIKSRFAKKSETIVEASTTGDNNESAGTNTTPQRAPSANPGKGFAGQPA